MLLLTRLARSLQNVSNCQRRNLCNTIREELTVQTFCDIHVDVPYNVRIKPLDVHKYHNCDLLRIELQGPTNSKTVKHIQDGNNIRIFASMQEYTKDVTCFIQAPVKANLDVIASGNIHSGVFGGSKLILKSINGNIYIDKFQGDTVNLITDDGDITFKGAVVASNIKAIVTKSGSIKTKRVQGLNILLRTNQGGITVDSSYCDNGTFEANSGDLNLQNIHKNTKVILNNGKLNLYGLDGQLDANLQNTSADIQISRILGDSKITMSGNSELQLKLSEDCQENTMFEIKCKEHVLDPSIISIPSKTDDTLYLTPTVGDKFKNVSIQCEEGRVDIKNSSWFNMLKLDVKK